MKFLIARIAPEVPLWMYYVRCGVEIVCAVADIFLLPFGRVCNLNTIWQGRILRSMSRQRKRIMKQSPFTRLKFKFSRRVGRWLTRVRNALSGSITVTVIQIGGSEILGESVHCVTRTLDGKSLSIVHLDGTITDIPFEELGCLLVTAY